MPCRADFVAAALESTTRSDAPPSIPGSSAPFVSPSASVFLLINSFFQLIEQPVTRSQSGSITEGGVGWQRTRTRPTGQLTQSIEFSAYEPFETPLEVLADNLSFPAKLDPRLTILQIFVADGMRTFAHCQPLSASSVHAKLPDNRPAALRRVSFALGPSYSFTSHPVSSVTAPDQDSLTFSTSKNLPEDLAAGDLISFSPAEEMHRGQFTVLALSANSVTVTSDLLRNADVADLDALDKLDIEIPGDQEQLIAFNSFVP